MGQQESNINLQIKETILYAIVNSLLAVTAI